MHLLYCDAAPLPAPEEITRDAVGAARVAELYAPPRDRLSVRAMMNTTIDGAIAGPDGTSASIAHPVDSFLFGVLRALTDVVVVGASTVRAEDYRRPGGRRDLREQRLRPSGAEYPAVAVITRSGNVPEQIEEHWPTFLVTPAQNVSAVRERTHLPADHVIAADSIRQMLDALEDRGFRAVQAEGGPSQIARFLAEDALDELCFSQTHITIGGDSPRAVHGAALRREWELASLIVGNGATLQRYRRRS